VSRGEEVQSRGGVEVGCRGGGRAEVVQRCRGGEEEMVQRCAGAGAEVQRCRGVELGC